MAFLEVPALVSKIASLDLSGPVRPIGQDVYRTPGPAGEAARREATIRRLIEHRDSAADDIRTMAPQKAGTEWHTDRIREIQACNRQLQRLGAIPADCVI